MLGYHPLPSPRGQTDTCKNITFSVMIPPAPIFSIELKKVLKHITRTVKSETKPSPSPYRRFCKKKRDKSKKCGCYHPVKCGISRCGGPTHTGVVHLDTEQWRIQGGRPYGPTFFLIFAVFGKTCMLAPSPGGLAPPPTGNPGSAPAENALSLDIFVFAQM